MKYIIFILFSLITHNLLFAQEETDTEIEQLLTQLKASKPDTSKISILNKLAVEYIGSDNEKATEYSKLAIELGTKFNSTNGLAQAYYNLAKSFYYQYEFDSIQYYYNTSTLLFKKIENRSIAANFESLMGYVQHIQSNYSEAISHYNKSLILNTVLDDTVGISYCHNDIGAAFYDLGNFEKALSNYFTSLKINEEIKDSSMIARTLANIGGIYEEQEKYSNALSYYQKALLIAKNIDAKNIIANTYLNIGGIFIEENNVDSTIIVYEKALTIYEDLQDIRGIVVLYNLLGQAYSSHNIENNPELLNKALNYFKKSLELNQREIEEVEEEIVSYQGMGEVYNIKGNFSKAIPYLTKAMTMAKEIESLTNIKRTHEFLSVAYAGIGNYEKAYTNYVNYKSLSDTLRNDENIELLTKTSMQYEFDKQQKEQEFVQAKKDLEYQQKQKRDRLIRIFILIGLSIVSLFSIQMFRSYKRKIKDNILLGEQNEEIEKQKEEITDSIRYAKRIQTAILPSNDWVNENLPEHFILFRPRDIVSGDYYWMNKIGDKVIIAAADCTGHGVPGAFMSMLGVSFLNEIVNKNNTIKPSLILNQLRSQVKKTLDQTGKEGEAKDGMDIAICVIDFKTMKLEYSGAYNPLYLFRNGELLETKADKMPIGIYIREKDSFTNHEINLETGDTFYIFSDGFADQFGGPKGGKFKSRPFKALLGNIQPKSMIEQWEILESTFDDWRGDIDQIDDVIILGVRV